MSGFGHSQDYRKEGLLDDILNAELDAEEAQRKSEMPSILPAPIDVAPLEQRLETERRDFDSKLDLLKQIDPATIEADMIGHQYAEAAAQYDMLAKQFVDAAQKEFAPAIEKQRVALKAVQDILARIIEAPLRVRALCKPISSAYQLAVNQKAEQDRRELERAQREQAERERQEELERLRQQAAAERDLAERARIEDEARQVAAAPAVPIAVPAAAVSQPKVPGMSGTPVFLRRVSEKLGHDFLRWLSGQPMSVKNPPDKRNWSILRFGSIEITVNFSKMLGTGRGVEIPGVELQESVDTRNLRKG